MKLSRYAIIDAYILEELRREYQNSDAKGRIRLLKKLYAGNHVPPYEIAVLAAENPHVEVRQWIARNGKHLDYRESHLVAIPGQEELYDTVFEFPDRDLRDRLKNDSDPFVRACLRENPSFAPSMEEFQKASHLERLALVRNLRVTPDLVEKIYDPDDKELGINLDARRELILAFLSNKEFLASIEKGAKRAGYLGRDWDDEQSYDYSPADERAYDLLTSVWRLAAKWPKGHEVVPIQTFSTVPVGDDVMCEVFKNTEVDTLREWIVNGVAREDNTELFRLALTDKDDFVRQVALSRIKGLTNQEIREVLVKSPSGDLRWFAQNSSLSEEVLKELREKLDADGVRQVDLTLEELQDKREEREVLTDDTLLFGWEGKGKYDSEKIHAIGRRLVALEKWMREWAAQMPPILRDQIKVEIQHLIMQVVWSLVAIVVLIAAIRWLRNIF